VKGLRVWKKKRDKSHKAIDMVSNEKEKPEYKSIKRKEKRGGKKAVLLLQQPNLRFFSGEREKALG
jgi:hypothetical protein